MGDPRAWLFIASWYLVWSVLAFLIFGFDKRAARRQQRRVPEARLHLLELMGGFPGALLAIRLLHHKSSKPRFLLVSVVCILCNLTLLAIGIRFWFVSG